MYCSNQSQTYLDSTKLSCKRNGFKSPAELSTDDASVVLFSGIEPDVDTAEENSLAI